MLQDVQEVLASNCLVECAEEASGDSEDPASQICVKTSRGDRAIEGFREFREFRENWVLCWLSGTYGFPNSTNLTLAPEDPAALESLNTLM